jgi:hypothetical protein
VYVEKIRIVLQQLEFSGLNADVYMREKGSAAAI